MKKLHFYLMVMLFALVSIPTSMMANEKNPANRTEVPAEVKTMLNRLDEIKEMEKSNLNSSEKKELRKEVKTIKHNLRSSGQGIYLSVGAIIIIVLLLILLL